MRVKGGTGLERGRRAIFLKMKAPSASTRLPATSVFIGQPLYFCSSFGCFGCSPSGVQLMIVAGGAGLGFTVTTREYASSKGFSPIIVKTVHRHGAAAVDGRLKPQDVLLKVSYR